MDAITKSIDAYHKKHPKLTVGQILSALDHIYGKLYKATVKSIRKERKTRAKHK
jgi:hypothetical protein